MTGEGGKELDEDEGDEGAGLEMDVGVATGLEREEMEERGNETLDGSSKFSGTFVSLGCFSIRFSIF